MVKLSDYLFGRIAREGVRHVFFVPGGGAMHLNDSLGANRQLEYVANLHEQASAAAAEAYAKLTNRLGVALVTAGPGGTNAITGLAGAWLDSSPCLFLSGQVKRADRKGNSGVRQKGVQEIDIVSVVGSLTKYAVTIDDPSTVRYHLERALFTSRAGRPGPVWLDIPLDVQAAAIDPDSLVGYTPEPPPRDTQLPAVITRTIELLERSERPVVLIGNGVRLAGGTDLAREVIEKIGAPVLLTWLALDLLPDDHPLFAGRPGAVAPRGANFTIQNSDFLLAIGARLDNVLSGYAPQKLARAARKVIVDVDPAEAGKHIGADLVSCTDAKEFLQELRRQWRSRPSVACGAWRARVADWRRRYPVVLPEHREHIEPISIYAFSEAMSEELKKGEILVNGSSGSGIEIFLHAFRIKEGQRFLHSTALGAMGFAVPMSIGACLAAGRARVAVVDGDGGFQFNIQEMETIRRLNLPIKFFVLDNDGYASIRASQKNYFGRLVGADRSSGLTLPSLERIAGAWEIPFQAIHRQPRLREQIREALDSPGPRICAVKVIPDEDRLPRIYSRIASDGSMISSPLEDLYPPLPREELQANMVVALPEESA